VPGSVAHFWIVFWDKLPYFLSVLLGAAGTTLKVMVGALAVALSLGLVLALLKLARFGFLRAIANVYIEIMRGTPALTQLFIIYFGLSDLGINIPPVPAAIVGLGMNGAAYVAEIYRAGILAIHEGQFEAALSLGMRPADTMRFIILPQAFRVMMPPLCNYAVGLLKDTSLASVVAAPEIMFFARQLVTETLLSLDIYLIVAVIYLCMSIPMGRLVAYLERARQAWQ
jgi:polar amino acid transport system permease protein/cystine transport system permease protein